MVCSDSADVLLIVVVAGQHELSSSPSSAGPEKSSPHFPFPSSSSSSFSFPYSYSVDSRDSRPGILGSPVSPCLTCNSVSTPYKAKHSLSHLSIPRRESHPRVADGSLSREREGKGEKEKEEEKKTWPQKQRR